MLNGKADIFISRDIKSPSRTITIITYITTLGTNPIKIYNETSNMIYQTTTNEQ